MSAREVSTRELMLAERIEMESAARAVALLAAEQRRLQALEEEGMVAESAVKEAEARLNLAREEARQAQIELELLEEALAAEERR